VRQVFFGQHYRDDSGLDLLREAKIMVSHCPI
jgi:cytosine/adenosine deaminase-related metal-dependent hydrolase